MPEYRTSLKVVDKPTKELADSLPVKDAEAYRASHSWDQAMDELDTVLLTAGNLAVTINAAFASEHTSQRFGLFAWLIKGLAQTRRRVEDLKCSYPQGKGRQDR